MGDIVSLNRVRKAKARADKEAAAAENRIRHGRTKAEKDLVREKDRLAARQIEAHRLKDEDS